jgi:hypothetical protein
MRKNRFLNAVLLLGIFILFSRISFSLSFTSNPSISPTNSSREQPLVCSWEAADATQQNVTWYNGTLAFNSTIDAASPVVVSNTYLTRGQIWNCTVSIGDGATLLTRSAVTTIKNALPSKPSALNATILEDSTYSYVLNSTDADSDTITYYYTSSNLTLTTWVSATGSFSWKPDYPNIGTNTITFYSKDNQEPTMVGIDVTFNVTAVNDAPEFGTVLSTQYATEGTLFTYNINATDEEGNTVFYYDNSSLFVIDMTTGAISFTPEFVDRGNHSIAINITDGQNSTISSFILVINTTNHLPNLNFINNLSLLQNESLLINITGYDLDNDTVTFSANPETFEVSTLINYANSTVNATGQINITPTDNNVGNNTIFISITDSRGGSSNQTINIEIININDPPNISLIPNQTGAAYVSFSLHIDASDPDLDSGDNLYYYDNTSLFNINIATGNINFTPNWSQIGNYSILITVNDSFGLSNYTIFNLQIINNSPPYFLEELTNQTAYEDSIFEYKINATDPDGGLLNFSYQIQYYDNATFFQINPETGLVNFTPDNSIVENYSITIRIVDALGSSNSSTFNLEIINTNDAPILGSIAFSTIVVGYEFYYELNATDDDLIYGDSLNFSVNDSSILAITEAGIINFTPSEADAGNHSINITVTDSYGASDSRIVNFIVYNVSSPPNISRVYPYGTPVSAYTLYAFSDRLNFPENTTSINATENMTINFMHETFDPDTPFGSLTFRWYFNNTYVNNTQNFSKYFDFFSNGAYNVTLIVQDDRYSLSSFTWNVDISNKNRPPRLVNDLQNISLNQTTTISNYLTGSLSMTRFIDPDDDLNSNNAIDGSETSTLTFNSTASSLASISINNADITITPLNTGRETIIFNAKDSEYAVQSNNVTLNITVPEVVEEGGSSETGTGGGSRTVEVEIEVPKPTVLKIITPGIVTIYKNNTITIPITIENTWNSTLQGIILSAQTNASNVSFEFDRSYFEVLAAGEKVNLNLTVSSYRSLSTYEIMVTAKVTNPDYKDNAVIYVNSIEKSLGRYSNEVTNTKITFARDLLEGNPECIELNELLKRAQIKADEENYEESNRILDQVIQGCKYLVNKAEISEEKPTFMRNLKALMRTQILNYLLAGIIITVIIVAISYSRKLRFRRRKSL